MWSDLKLTIRQISRDPRFSVFTVLVIALGIGVNTAAFSLLHSILFEPLPFARSHDLLAIRSVVSSSAFGDFEDGNIVTEDLQTWVEGSRTVEGFAVVNDAGFDNIFHLTGWGDPVRLDGAVVSPNFFSVLGVHPIQGSDWGSTESELDDYLVAVMSHSLWQDRLGANPDLIGETIRLNDRSYRLLGVMPEGFGLAYPAEEGGHEVDLWVPDPARRMSGRVIARKNRGVSTAEVSAELARLTDSQDRRVRVVPLLEQLVGFASSSLWVVLGAVGLVLILIAANLAGLQIARMAGRSAELSIRAAIGASRMRLMRLVAAEGMILALFGGVLGFVSALWLLEILLVMAPGWLPRIADVSVSGASVAFTVFLSVVIGLFIGLIPAFRASRKSPSVALRGRTPGGVGSGKAGSWSFWDTLVSAQVGLATLSLMGSGLMVRTYFELHRVDPGIRTEGVLAMDLYRPLHLIGGDQELALYHESVVDAVRSLPGVEQVALTSSVPFRPRDYFHPRWNSRIVNAEYFELLGVAPSLGRVFDQSDVSAPDGAKIAEVGVLSESLARQEFGGENPLGKVFDDYQIIGVVPDNRHTGFTEDPVPTLYRLASQNIDDRMSLLVRMNAEASTDRATLVSLIQERIWTAGGRNQPIENIGTLDEFIERTPAVSTNEFNLRILTAMALLGVILAALGIYGVISQYVVQRSPEFGLRIALGAQHNRLLRTVYRKAATVSVVGLGAGVLASFFAMRLIQSFLFRQAGVDVLTLLAVCLILFMAVSLAVLGPAIKAVRSSPLQTLRRS